MLLKDFVRILEQTLPPSTAMEGDRLGLQVQNERNEVASVLTCLEITDEVLSEAVSLGCDCILTFHPLIFSPLYSLQSANRVGRCLLRAIRNDIAVVSAHTNFDAHPRGTNYLLAQRLGLGVERALVPDASVESFGMGVLCSTAPLRLEELVDRVRTVCSSPVRYCAGSDEAIRSVAIVGGSGSSFLRDALQSGAQAFITADVKYHTFHDAWGRIALIDPGHYEMEQFVPEGLAQMLTEVFRSAEDAPRFRSTSFNTNPIRYVS